MGSATAKKIIAGRPYSSVDDLSKSGVSASTIKKIAPFVTVGGSAPASAPSQATTTATTKPAPTAKPAKTTDTNTKVDLNNASEKDLDSLPGVGSATAKKIISGRPYSSVDDLSKSGISASTIKKIAPLVMVSDGAAVAKNATASAPSSQPTSPTPNQPSPTSPTKTSAPSSSQGNPGSGMVWVNLDSGIYHYEAVDITGKRRAASTYPKQTLSRRDTILQRTKRNHNKGECP